MHGLGARFNWNRSPTLIYMPVFCGQTFTKYICSPLVLPLRLEDIPDSNRTFDTIFSMEFSYHRKSPSDHLKHIYQIMRPSAELILETLVIDDSIGDILKPKDRYAKMKKCSVYTIFIYSKRMA